MTKETVGKRPKDKRVPVDAADLAAAMRQIALLLEELTHPQGSRFDAGQVAAALEALRHGRFTIEPPAPISRVLEEWPDWSDLDEVPLRALGLRTNTYKGLRKVPTIDTVGLLLKHSFPVVIRGRLTSAKGPLAQDLRDCVAARGLSFADDCSRLPIDFVKGNTHFFSWSEPKALDDFMRQHGIVTLGDLARLTPEQIASKNIPAEAIKASWEDEVPVAELVRRIVSDIGRALSYYQLPYNET